MGSVASLESWPRSKIEKWRVTRREERSRQRLGDRKTGEERDGEREKWDVFARWANTG